MDDSAVKVVFFHVQLGDGKLTLVEMTDGSLRILRDDKPLDGCCFARSELSLAAARFWEVRNQLLPPKI
jgi:hypothetical protein